MIKRKHITRFYGRCQDYLSNLHGRLRHFERKTGTWLAHLKGQYEPRLIQAQRRRVEWWIRPIRYPVGKGVTLMNTMYIRSIRKGLQK